MAVVLHKLMNYMDQTKTRRPLVVLAVEVQVMSCGYCHGHLPGWLICNARVGWASPDVPAPPLGRSMPFFL
jgi:hypothetical protein